MKLTRRQVLAIMAGGAIGAGLPAPLPAQWFGFGRQRTKEIDRTLRIGIGDEPETLDPTMMRGSVEHRVIVGLMESLVGIDNAGRGVPAAAESWIHNADFTEWTFKLRKDARWHNGDPVTAHDFVYAVRRICTARIAAPYAGSVYGFLAGGEEYFKAGGMDSDAKFPGVEAIDDHTVLYRLVAPTPFFESVVYLFSWMPINRRAVEAGGENWHRSPETFVGNGPFRLTRWAPRSGIEAERADTYWDRESIWMERLVWRPITEESTELAAFQTGDLDATSGVPIPELPAWRGRPEYRSHRFFGTLYVAFNNKRAPFDNVNVRRAFSRSIDRNQIVSRVTRRNEPVSRGIIPAHLASARGATWADHVEDFIGPMDREQARRLLAEAGYADGVGFPAVEYIYNTREENKMVAEALQNQWRRALGIEVRLQNLEWGQWLANTRRGEYDLGRMSWFGDYLDAMTFMELFTTESTQNTSHYSNPRYDDLVSRARREGDAPAREKLLAEAEKLLVDEDCAIAPLYTYDMPILAKANLTDFGRNAIGGLVYTRARRE